MPELKFRPVRADKIQPGDKYQGKTVATRDSKTKWTVITWESQPEAKLQETELRVLNDAELSVGRWEDTEEEKRAKHVKRTLQALDVKESSARKELIQARHKMLVDMETGERASHWRWMDVPLAEALVEIWDAVTHVHLQHALHDQPITRIEAVRIVRDARVKKALSYYSATSRSSGQISNLFEDIERQALSYWMRELEWVIED